MVDDLDRHIGHLTAGTKVVLFQAEFGGCDWSHLDRARSR
jgi:hypothetical protein